MKNLTFTQKNWQKQTGFLLPAAIFLLVILAGLGAYAVNISTVQQNSSTQDVQGTRAYHAARAGIEWAAYQIIQTSPVASLPACPATTTLALDGFSVAVSCTQTADYTEQGGDHTIRVYQIASKATFGTVNTLNYIERQMDMTISKCIGTDETPSYQCS
jgi:MSHA biogenesis protein MshP